MWPGSLGTQNGYSHAAECKQLPLMLMFTDLEGTIVHIWHSLFKGMMI